MSISLRALGIMRWAFSHTAFWHWRNIRTWVSKALSFSQQNVACLLLYVIFILRAFHIVDPCSFVRFFCLHVCSHIFSVISDMGYSMYRRSRALCPYRCSARWNCQHTVSGSNTVARNSTLAHMLWVSHFSATFCTNESSKKKQKVLDGRIIPQTQAEPYIGGILVSDEATCISIFDSKVKSMDR